MPRQRFSEVGMLINMGSPFLNLMTAAFLKIGAVAAMRKAALQFCEYYRGYVPRSYLKDSLKHIALEGVYWGLMAAVYVGIDYGMYKIFGFQDWKNALVAGALTGDLASSTSDIGGLDCTTGAAIAIAAELFNNLP